MDRTTGTPLGAVLLVLLALGFGWALLGRHDGMALSSFGTSMSESDFAAALGNIVNHWLTQPFCGGAIQKSHLGAIFFLKEAIESGEKNGGGNFFGTNKVQRLGHGDEDFLLYSWGNVLLLHPF